MSPRDIAGWIRQRKAAIGISNAELAERSGVPLSTINRILGSGWSNYRIDTIAPILTVLVGGWPDTACPEDAGGELYIMRDRVTHLERELSFARHRADQAHEAAQGNVDTLHAQADAQDARLRHMRRLVYALGIALLAVLLGVIGLLIYDINNLSVGYFRG